MFLKVGIISTTFFYILENLSTRNVSDLSKVAHLLSDKSSTPALSCVLFLTCHPGCSPIECSMVPSHFIRIAFFPLEVIGDSLCGYNFKFLFLFFSQKEALERARLQEKTPHTRYSKEEDSSDPPSSSLVRMILSEKLLINSFILWRLLPRPSINLISIEKSGKGRFSTASSPLRIKKFMFGESSGITHQCIILCSLGLLVPFQANFIHIWNFWKWMCNEYDLSHSWSGEWLEASIL